MIRIYIVYLVTINVNYLVLFHHCCDTLSNLQTPGLNITEYMMGLIYPGRPIANVSFKVYGYMSMAQAVSFLNDFKLGHYMKIPPRSMFLVQVNTSLLAPPSFPTF